MDETVGSQRDVLKNLSVAVFGGGGRWGTHIADASRKLRHPVQVVEREDGKDPAPAELIEAARQNDVVFLAVPDPRINGILIEIRDVLTGGKAILDCATNKSGFADTLKEIAHTGISVCSTHPMVKPETPPRGQTVIVMPVGENWQLAMQVAETVFGTMGMNSQHLEFDLHAETMVILQMVPHLIQRMLIDAMGKALEDKEMTIKEVQRLAPANYLLAELGVGRVGTQHPEVSAGIVASALQTRFGKRILGGIQSTLGEIVGAGEDREELSNLFRRGVKRLDPDAAWRTEMTVRTEAALTRLGNLRSRSCQVNAPNKPAILRDILNIFYDKYQIDMTALDSQVIHNDDGSSTARFDIGITDQAVNFREVAADLQEIGCELTFPDVAQ